MTHSTLSAFCKALLVDEHLASLSWELSKVAERDTNTAALAGAGAAGATLTRVPQKLLHKGALKSLYAIEKLEGRLPLKERLKAMVENRHIILPGKESQVTVLLRHDTHKVIPGTKRLYLSPTASRGTLEHELGHLRDPNIIGPISHSPYRNTYRTLRNEFVANASSIRRRGIKQVPIAAASYSTYLTHAAHKHPRLAAAGAGTLSALATKRLLNRKKREELLKKASVVEEYAKHTALNLGQAARDIRYLTDHPGAPEGDGHAFESVKRRLPSLLNNLFYAAVPPHLHHEKAELAAMGGSLGDWYRRGYAPWKHAAPAARIADAPSDSTEKQAKVALAGIEYRGKTFPGYNQPISSDQKDKKMMVLAKKGDEVRLLHFGQKGYQHNYSPEAKANYLKRSAGIRSKDGQLTKDDKFSPNYWARRVLWPKGETGAGKNGPINLKAATPRKKES